MKLRTSCAFLVMACTATVRAQDLDYFKTAEIGSTMPGPYKKEYYCDPVNGSSKGDGSKAKPWGRLEDVLTAKLVNGEDSTKGVVHAGDKIYLLSGHHGRVLMTKYVGQFANTDFITVEALDGHEPVLGQLSIDSAAKWVFRGIVFTPNVSPVPKHFCLARFIKSSHIVFDQNKLYSSRDVIDWTAEDWDTRGAGSAISFKGDHATITKNTIFNMRNCCNLNGDSILFSDNSIDYFCDDGIDVTSSNTIIRGNTITNHFGGLDDANHNDGIQGWTVDGRVTSNLLIDANIVMASTGKYATIPPLATASKQDYMQGISIFDGQWTNVVVTNNVVGAASHHGISMYGMNGCIIANNTVVTQTSAPKIRAWIGVFDSKTKAPPVNVIVRNNIASAFNLETSGRIDDHNIALSRSTWSGRPDEIIVTDPKSLFVTYDPANAKFDLRLKKPGGNSKNPAIGRGNRETYPPLDVLGLARSASTDLGAYSSVED